MSNCSIDVLNCTFACSRWSAGLHRNPAVLTKVGGHWTGLDDLENETCAWVSWFNEERFHGELDDLSPAEVEAAYYERSQPSAA